MIDKIVSKIIKDKKDNYLSKEFIKKNFTYIKNSKKLYIFFPGWGGKMKLNTIIRKKITAANNSLLEYSFDKGIFSSDIKKTLNCFEKIKKESYKDITHISKKYHINEINIIGLSLGTISALIMAKKIKNNQTILIIGGNSLANITWESIATKKIKKELEIQHISLKELKKRWKKLEPEENIKYFKGKEIILCVGKKDKIVPYHLGKKLAKAIRKNKIKLTLYKKKYAGHYLAGISFHINPEKVIFN